MEKEKTARESADTKTARPSETPGCFDSDDTPIQKSALRGAATAEIQCRVLPFSLQMSPKLT
jgi:hypothetical protein